MNRVILLSALSLAAAVLAATPAAAASEAEGRAVAACRTEMLSRFAPEEVRSYRVGEIASNSRSPRVTLIVQADRRYAFHCAADRQGQIVTASFDPARPGQAQLAAGNR